MDKNIAAFVREDTFTALVTSAQSTAPQTVIVCAVDLAVGDNVVIMINEQYRVVRVTEVHDDLRIPTNHEYTFPWVIQKLDTSAYDRIMAENNKFGDKLKNAYRSNVRKQARAAVLGEFGLSTDASFSALLTSDHDPVSESSDSTK